MPSTFEHGDRVELTEELHPGYWTFDTIATTNITSYDFTLYAATLFFFDSYDILHEAAQHLGTWNCSRLGVCFGKALNSFVLHLVFGGASDLE